MLSQTSGKIIPRSLKTTQPCAVVTIVYATEIHSVMNPVVVAKYSLHCNCASLAITWRLGFDVLGGEPVGAWPYLVVASITTCTVNALRAGKKTLSKGGIWGHDIFP